MYENVLGYSRHSNDRLSIRHEEIRRRQQYSNNIDSYSRNLSGRDNLRLNYNRGENYSRINGNGSAQRTNILLNRRSIHMQDNSRDIIIPMTAIDTNEHTDPVTPENIRQIEFFNSNFTLADLPRPPRQPRPFPVQHTPLPTEPFPVQQTSVQPLTFRSTPFESTPLQIIQFQPTPSSIQQFLRTDTSLQNTQLYPFLLQTPPLQPFSYAQLPSQHFLSPHPLIEPTPYQQFPFILFSFQQMTFHSTPFQAISSQPIPPQPIPPQPIPPQLILPQLILPQPILFQAISSQPIPPQPIPP
ncbi:hypothetical protein CWI37_2528p0010, partial [Hamiltosporidium tvaerminnensis]